MRLNDLDFRIFVRNSANDFRHPVHGYAGESADGKRSFIIPHKGSRLLKKNLFIFGDVNETAIRDLPPEL